MKKLLSCEERSGLNTPAIAVTFSAAFLNIAAGRMMTIGTDVCSFGVERNFA